MAHQPRAYSSLQATVARFVGKENNAVAKTEAGEYINDIINDLNLEMFEFQRAKGSATTLTASTADYADSLWTGTANLAFKVEKVELVKVADSAPVRVVKEYDYATYKDYDSALVSGSLAYYTARNLHADGKLTFLSAPTAADAAAYKFRVDYFKRMVQLSAAGDILDVPREAERVIIQGAKYLMRDADRGFPEETVMRDFKIYTDLKARLHGLDMKHPNLHRRFRLNVA